MNPKKTCFRVSVGLVFLFSFFGIESMFAQVPNRYLVYNKTECTTDVTAHCSDGTSSGAIMAPDDFLGGTCPTNEYLCYVEMEFPSSNVLIAVVPTSIAPPCLSHTQDIVSDTCYEGNISWNTTSNYINCTIH